MWASVPRVVAVLRVLGVAAARGGPRQAVEVCLACGRVAGTLAAVRPAGVWEGVLLEAAVV